MRFRSFAIFDKKDNAQILYIVAFCRLIPSCYYYSANWSNTYATKLNSMTFRISQIECNLLLKMSVLQWQVGRTRGESTSKTCDRVPVNMVPDYLTDIGDTVPEKGMNPLSFYPKTCDCVYMQISVNLDWKNGTKQKVTSFYEVYTCTQCNCRSSGPGNHSLFYSMLRDLNVLILHC